MTLVWEQTSRTGSYDRGKWTGSTTYLIYDSAGASLTVHLIRNGASAAGTLDFGAGNEIDMAALMLFTGATYTPVQDGSDKYWTGVHSFESSTTIDGVAVEGQDVLQEKQVGFTSIEVNAQANIVDVWRTGATLPSSDALKTAPTLIDILGTKVDSAGDPISSIQGVLNISVRNVVIGRPNYLVYANTIGKRNSAIFTFGASATASQNLACPIGTLVFDGATSSRIGPNQYEVNFSFTLDTQTFHLKQVPLRNADGSVVPDQVTAGAVVSVGNPWRAAKVYYKQPFPNTDSFAGLGVVTT
jgi:hypothetical protein